MLELRNIVKDYATADMSVRALNDVNLTFRKAEFVAVLGPSGCGKTTMLNIVGGLDRYTEGDLVISGKSTKDFKTYDWDAYRNSCVGFVFQNYNLIPHQNVVGNVELALTLSGISKSERRKRALDALKKVGLENQAFKRPNQLSGGQMQRVAIARAIVNDPEIILADEPTGALDSKTSVQIADLLKEIAKERLVIMVTHNNELAQQYATRTVQLLDGKVVGDTRPYTVEDEIKDEKWDSKSVDETIPEIQKAGMDEKQLKKAEKARAKQVAKAKKAKLKRTSMSFFTAMSLSFNNLKTKKGRTFMTSFAGSIGIIGIALVLSISNGFSLYINKMQSDTLAGFPVTVSQYTVDQETLTQQMGGMPSVDLPAYPESGEISVYEPQRMQYHYNAITQQYVDYVAAMDASLYNDVSYSYGITSHVLAKTQITDNGVVSTEYERVSTSSGDMMSSIMGTQSGNWQELASSQQFVTSQYDVIDGRYPTQKNELALVVDQYNRISTSALGNINLAKELVDGKTLSEMTALEYKVVLNDEWYVHYPENSTKGSYGDPVKADYAALYDNENNLTLNIVGIMRIKQDSPLSIYNTGIVYTPALSAYLREDGKQSEIGKKQLADSEYNFTTGRSFALEAALAGGSMDMDFRAEQIREAVLQGLGASDIPTNIYIYPKGFESKSRINKYLDAYNVSLSDNQRILYMDAASLLSDTMGTLIDIISYALVAFAAVSLIVSSIMIGIITYVSVIERTKEIGVLRSIGARKKDISRVFNAETLLIGFVAGVLGVAIAFILTFPVSAVIKGLADGMVTTNLAVLNPLAGLILVGVSMLLTLIAGAMPARMAAKKDPVVALRSE